MAKNSFFFIPDITGFTSFVKGVEVEHSKHIISELLELIIDADELNLSVVEVEGDAVFFYKHEDVPKADDILNQVQKTFIRFQEHLKLYETRRVCQCGACISASSLSLKFVAHQGEANMINVKGNEKPFGEHVVLAHRLLKNKIIEKAYLLYTENLINDAKIMANDADWKKVRDEEEDFEGLGKIAYKNIELSFLQKKVVTPPPIKYGAFYSDPLHHSVTIKSSKTQVFELITNMDVRYKWNRDVSSFKYKKGEINRVGSKHICVIGNKSVEFETVTNDFGQDKLVYGEKAAAIPLLKEAISYYIIEGNEEETQLRTELHYKFSSIIGWLIKPVLIRFQMKVLRKTLSRIKEVAETEDNAKLLKTA